jgi:hypothetical protein
MKSAEMNYVFSKEVGQNTRCKTSDVGEKVFSVDTRITKLVIPHV